MFLEPHDPRWSGTLARARHDVYHLPSYAEAEAERLGGTATAFHRVQDGTEVLIPLVRRPVPDRPGWEDLVSPYGYPGPVTTRGAPTNDPAFWQAVFADMREEMRRASLLTAFLRLHPILNAPLVAVCGGSEGMRVEGPTVGADLEARDDEELLAGLSAGHRRYVRKLLREGFVPQVDDWSLYPQFIAMYHDTMRRVDASSSYFFPQEYYEALTRGELGRHTHLVTVQSREGELAAASLFFACDGLVQYHLSGSSESYQRLSPTKLVIFEAMRWGARTGHGRLHLGGGLGARDDSLLRFKRGFASFTSTFATMCVLAEPDVYAQLCGVSADPYGGYFPAYRAGA